VAHDLHAITTTHLIPLPEPEQGNNFLSGKATLDKALPFEIDCLKLCRYGKLFYSMNLWIYHRVLSIRHSISRTIANSLLIRLLKVLPTCPRCHEEDS